MFDALARLFFKIVGLLKELWGNPDVQRFLKDALKAFLKLLVDIAFAVVKADTSGAGAGAGKR